MYNRDSTIDSLKNWIENIQDANDDYKRRIDSCKHDIAKWSTAIEDNLADLAEYERDLAILEKANRG
jgi:peptidoglycan hydrolase CwlO-like protein